MFRRGNNSFFCARVVLSAFSLFLIFTSTQSIQCTSSYPDEFLDFCMIHKTRIGNPSQSLDVIVVHDFSLATIQIVRCESLDLPYPERVMFNETLTTILRC